MDRVVRQLLILYYYITVYICILYTLKTQVNVSTGTLWLNDLILPTIIYFFTTLACTLFLEYLVVNLEVEVFHFLQ